VERVFKLLLALLSASLLGTALWVGPDPAAILRGTLALELPAQVGPFDALLVALGMVGAVGGSLMNLVYPYFLEEKGWRGPRYRRIQSADFALAVCAMIAFDLAVWTLGAELVHERGGRVSDLEGLTALLGALLGPGGRLLFLLGVFAAVYTSVLGSGLGLGLLASHAWQRWRTGAAPAPGALRAHPAYRWVATWVLLSPLFWTALEGADFVQLTQCSSVGEVAELAAKLVRVPVVRVDERMARVACETGERLGVVATLETTLGPTCRLLESTARAQGKRVEILRCLVRGAFEALTSGDRARHNRMVQEALRDLSSRVDVVVCAQGSMVAILADLGATPVPVLTSPRLGVEHALEVLDRGRS
jgi:hypothetical protein